LSMCLHARVQVGEGTGGGAKAARIMNAARLEGTNVTASLSAFKGREGDDGGGAGLGSTTGSLGLTGVDPVGEGGNTGAWCGVVWRGVAWFGVVWCGVVWRGVAWSMNACVCMHVLILLFTYLCVRMPPH
jgi:hypothetical protein